MLSSVSLCRADEVYTGGVTVDITGEILGYVWIEDATVNLLSGAHIKNSYYMGDVYAASGAVVNIYGGQIDDMLLITTAYNGLPDPYVTLYGTAFAVDGVPVAAGTTELYLANQVISGLYGDGSAFAIRVDCFAEGNYQLTLHLSWLDQTPEEPEEPEEPEPVPAMEVSLTAVDFGQVQVGTFGEQFLTVSNIGGAPLTIASAYVEQDDTFEFYTTGLRQATVTLQSGESTVLGVLFAPAAEGTASATLVLLSNDPDTAQVEIALTGEGFVPLTCAQQIQAILTFFDESAAAGTLKGTGWGKSAVHRLTAVRYLLEAAKTFIEQKNYGTAAVTLKAVLLKIDGRNWPSDFVTGPAAEELQVKILLLLEDLKKL